MQIIYKFIVYTFIICFGLATLLFLYLYLAHYRPVVKWATEKPVGIDYIEHDLFTFPKKFGVCVINRCYGNITLQAIFPLTGNTKELFASDKYDNITHILQSPDLKHLYFVAYGENNPQRVICRLTGTYYEELYKTDKDIIHLSLSPNSEQLLFFTEYNNHGLKPYLVDLKSGALTSVNIKTSHMETPVDWIYNNIRYDRNPQGITQFNPAKEQYEVIVRGHYRLPIVWKNTYLILQLEYIFPEEVYLSNLDGTEKRLLFKNNLLRKNVVLSPDEKYLVGRVIIFDEKQRKAAWFVHAGFEYSLFVLNLENKKFTYFYPHENDYSSDIVFIYQSEE